MEENKKNKIPNVPNLRFPEYSSEWITTKYGSVCKVFSGGTPKSSNKEYYKGDIPFIRSGEIHLDKTELFINEKALRESSAKMIKKGDLLLALYGATSGEIDISRIEGAINQAILCIKTDQNKRFIKYGWESKVTKYLSTYLQGGQGNLSAEIFKSIRVDLAEKNEQAKIANFLVLLDGRIETQNKIIEKLESLMTSIKEQIYLLGDIKVPFKKVLFERVDKSKLQNQCPVLSSTVKGLFLQSEYFDRSVASENNIGYKIVHRGQIIISPQNLWMGNITFNNRFDNGIVSPSYKIYEINPKYNKKYVYWLLTSKRSFFNYGLVSEQGASIVRRNLNVDAFMELCLPIVSDKYVENKIEKLINLIDEKLELEKKRASLLAKQKEFLLNNLFI